jgi:hypothetical protein
MGGREDPLDQLNDYQAQMSTVTRKYLRVYDIFMLDVILPIWHTELDASTTRTTRHRPWPIRQDAAGRAPQGAQEHLGVCQGL